MQLLKVKVAGIFAVPFPSHLCWKNVAGNDKWFSGHTPK
jgi:hypothetical protein